MAKGFFMYFLIFYPFVSNFEGIEGGFMKKSHILILVVIAAAIAIIVSTAGDASTYVTFDEAQAMWTSGNKKEIHVVGELKKDAEWPYNWN